MSPLRYACDDMSALCIRHLPMTSPPSESPTRSPGPHLCPCNRQQNNTRRRATRSVLPLDVRFRHRAEVSRSQVHAFLENERLIKQYDFLSSPITPTSVKAYLLRRGQALGSAPLVFVNPVWLSGSIGPVPVSLSPCLSRSLSLPLCEDMGGLGLGGEPLPRLWQCTYRL
ncbi:hypothetical protein CALVIDRAFT_186502 [Calocera viscosa TUFC12733]|uniref:Uncharacterized protein n=1 Tax=Calocera viscosa (strain TUFC12733) TaxID=1330018 RepID=A0A167KTL5_CALVF|nr:hypothetical protein CALVIDRAFT_186502 [Calocera viscosa TUFC12733]